MEFNRRLGGLFCFHLQGGTGLKGGLQGVTADETQLFITLNCITFVMSRNTGHIAICRWN
jgi:hypothetical protein